MQTGGDVDAIAEVIRDTIQGANVQTEKIKTLSQLLATEEDAYATWFDILEEFRLLSEIEGESVNESPLPATPLLKRAGITELELKRIANKLTPEKFMILVLYKMQEKTVFKYCIPGGAEIEFEQASAGQQATALLRALLLEEGPPLIIDQPEDDLDNEVIKNIAELLWEAKRKRQIVASSHNANLVVIGDADLVVHFGYENSANQSVGEIKNQGAIDVSSIKEAVKVIMEGGNEAFKFRLDKYGF